MSICPKPFQVNHIHVDSFQLVKPFFYVFNQSPANDLKEISTTTFSVRKTIFLWESFWSTPGGVISDKNMETRKTIACQKTEATLVVHTYWSMNNQLGMTSDGNHNALIYNIMQVFGVQLLLSDEQTSIGCCSAHTCISPVFNQSLLYDMKVV